MRPTTPLSSIRAAKRLSVHTVDYFRAIVDDPYVFGKIAANHALGDIYAMGAEPQTALAIATVPYGIEAKVEADLSQMMAGANEILREAGCALVGGHTSEGAELSLGFAVNGLVDRDTALRKGGLQPGDALILTKPIGTGSLLAAHMRGKAKARWVMAAIAHMTQSNQAAARILRAHGVQCCHRRHGLRAARTSRRDGQGRQRGCTLWLQSVPLLDGLRETMAAGDLLLAAAAECQTAQGDPQSRSGGRPIRSIRSCSTPRLPAACSASVPSSNARRPAWALRAAGYASAAIVGQWSRDRTSLGAITVSGAEPKASGRAQTQQLIETSQHRDQRGDIPCAPTRSMTPGCF